MPTGKVEWAAQSKEVLRIWRQITLQWRARFSRYAINLYCQKRLLEILLDGIRKHKSPWLRRRIQAHLGFLFFFTKVTLKNWRNSPTTRELKESSFRAVQMFQWYPSPEGKLIWIPWGITMHLCGGLALRAFRERAHTKKKPFTTEWLLSRKSKIVIP